jgi:hypothetical protein
MYVPYPPEEIPELNFRPLLATYERHLQEMGPMTDTVSLYQGTFLLVLKHAA